MVGGEEEELGLAGRCLRRGQPPPSSLASSSMSRCRGESRQVGASCLVGAGEGQNGKVGREGRGLGHPYVLPQVPCRRILLSGAYGGAGRLGRGCPTAPGPKPACGVGMGRRAASPPWVQDVGSVSAQQPEEAQGWQVRGGRWSPCTAPSLIHTLQIGPGRPPSPLWRELEGPQC